MFRHAVEPSRLPSVLYVEATDFREIPNDRFLRAIVPAQFGGTLTAKLWDILRLGGMRVPGHGRFRNQIALCMLTGLEAVQRGS